MDLEFHRILAESKILHTFTQFLMFEFSQRSKRQIAECNCLILQYKRKGQTQQKNIYLKMNNLDYLKKITDNLFVKITYEKSTAYIFFDQTNQNIVYAITTLNKSSYLPILDDLLKTEAKLCQNYSASLQYQIKLKIDYHCEKVDQNEIIVYYNTTAKIGKTIGNFFGTISQKLSKTVQSAEKTISKKVETVGRQSFSAETRSKWQSIKDKASNLNEKLTDLMKPVSEKASQLAEKVSVSYNKSQNSIVKSVRQFTKQAQNSINQGYTQESKVTKNPQSSNIIKVQQQLQSGDNSKSNLKEGILTDDYPLV